MSRTARLAPLDPPYDPELAAELAAMMPPGVPPLRLFRTLAHNRRVLRKVRAGNLLDRGSIERREREIVILRTTARCGAEYEWGVHVAFFAAKVGLDEAQVRATARGAADDPAWSERDRLLVRLADELHDASALKDDLWRALAAHWTPEQLVELVVLAGSYHTISFALNAFGVEHEAGAPKFPA
jgi:alkylhydroperoxidase family enzyme